MIATSWKSAVLISIALCGFVLGGCASVCEVEVVGQQVPLNQSVFVIVAGSDNIGLLDTPDAIEDAALNQTKQATYSYFGQFDRIDDKLRWVEKSSRKNSESVSVETSGGKPQLTIEIDTELLAITPTACLAIITDSPGEESMYALIIGTARIQEAKPIQVGIDGAKPPLILPSK